jgi:hypothetical protein
VAAWPQESKALLIDPCPFCGRNHWHAPRASPYEDIRQAPCLQKHLPKALRGRALFYRLHRATRERRGEVIPFPAVAAAKRLDPDEKDMDTIHIPGGPQR